MQYNSKKPFSSENEYIAILIGYSYLKGVCYQHDNLKSIFMKNDQSFKKKMVAQIEKMENTDLPIQELTHFYQEFFL